MFLVEETDGPADVDAIIKEEWKLLFEYGLYRWMKDKVVWPKHRTFKVFMEWFDVEDHSVVIDLLDEPIQLEDF